MDAELDKKFRLTERYFCPISVTTPKKMPIAAAKAYPAIFLSTAADFMVVPPVSQISRAVRFAQAARIAISGLAFFLFSESKECPPFSTGERLESTAISHRDMFGYSHTAPSNRKTMNP